MKNPMADLDSEAVRAIEARNAWLEQHPMSSEQVIAEVVAEIRLYADDDEYAGKLHRMAHHWADRLERLSTPAAGGDVEVAEIVRDLRDVAKADGWVCVGAAADLIEQLQARNAEQAAERGELLNAISDRKMQIFRLQEQLTALLDGIEGLEKEWHDYPELDQYTLGLEAAAIELKSLRESSVPAIGEKEWRACPKCDAWAKE